MIRKLCILLALLTFVPAATLTAPGCASVKGVPLFNPDAPLKNRIGSGYELLSETRIALLEARDNQWISQEAMTKRWSPQLDTARAMIDEADTLRVAGDLAGSAAKLDIAKNVLQMLRSQLESLKASK